MGSRGDVQIKKLVLGPWMVNCHVLICPEAKESVIVDPGDEAAKILDAVQGTNVKYILLTHGDVDHIGALEEVARATRAPVGVHPWDISMLPCPPEFTIEDGDSITFGHQLLTVIHTPGHTPGSVGFLIGKDLIGGDTLFPGGPGRSKSPYLLRQIVNSIQSRLLPLPDDTVVHPGHGDSTTIGQARKEVAVFLARPEEERRGLFGDVTWEG